MKDQDMQENTLFSKKRLLTVAVATALVAMAGCGGSSDSDSTTDTSTTDQTVSDAGDSSTTDSTTDATAATATVTVAARSVATENAVSDESPEDVIGSLVFTVRDKADGSVVTTVVAGTTGIESLELETGEYGIWAEDPNGVYAPSYCNLSVDTDTDTTLDCTIVMTAAAATTTILPFSANAEDRTVYGSEVGADEGLVLVFPQSSSGDPSFYYEDLSQAVAEYDGRFDAATAEYVTDPNAVITVAVRLVDLTQLENASIFPGAETTPNQEDLVPIPDGASLINSNGETISLDDLTTGVSSSTMLIVAMTHDGRRVEPVPPKTITSTTPIFGSSSTVGGGQYQVGDTIHSTHLAGGDLSWESEATGVVVACDPASASELCATFEVPRFCSYTLIEAAHNQTVLPFTLQVGETSEVCATGDAGCLEYQVTLIQTRPDEIQIPGTIHMTNTTLLHDRSGIDSGAVSYQSIIGLFPSGTTYVSTHRNTSGGTAQSYHHFDVPGTGDSQNKYYYFESNVWSDFSLTNQSLSLANSNGSGTGLGDAVSYNMQIATPISNRCTGSGGGFNQCVAANTGQVTDQRWVVDVVLEARLAGSSGAWTVVGTQELKNHVGDGSGVNASSVDTRAC